MALKLNCISDMEIQNNMIRALRTLITLTVAYMTFIGAILFSVTSKAEIKEPGTFVPAACGEAAIANLRAPAVATEEATVSKVCMGNIAGEPVKSQMGAFEFYDESGKSAVYRVTEVSNLLIKLMSGEVRSQVYMVGPNGDEVAMKINRVKDGSFRNATGQIGDAKFNIPQFVPVAVTL